MANFSLLCCCFFSYWAVKSANSVETFFFMCGSFFIFLLTPLAISALDLAATFFLLVRCRLFFSFFASILAVNLFLLIRCLPSYLSTC